MSTWLPSTLPFRYPIYPGMILVKDEPFFMGGKSTVEPLLLDIKITKKYLRLPKTPKPLVEEP